MKTSDLTPSAIKMIDDQQKPTSTPTQLVFLSVAGSVASIVALLIVLVQEATHDSPIASESVVWRIILSAIALVGAGGTVAYTYLVCRRIQLSALPHDKKVLRICFANMAGLLAFGICVNGFFAALHWTRWMWIVGRLLFH